MTRYSWLALVLAVGPVAAQPSASVRKVVVYAMEAADCGRPGLAEELALTTVAALGRVSGWRASSARPTDDAAASRRADSAGETAKSLAAATGADAVMLLAVARVADRTPQFLASVAGWDSRTGLLDVLPPVRTKADAAEALPAAVAALACAWTRNAAYPRAEVLEAQPVDQRYDLLVRLDAPLPANAGGYDAELLAQPLDADATHEHVSGPAYALGRCLLQGAEGDRLHLTVGNRVPLSVGSRLRLLPAGGGLTQPDGQAVAVTTRPWGALAAVDGETRGITPTLLGLAPNDREVGVNHAAALPWQQVVTPEQRVAGLLALALSTAAAPAATAATPAKLRVESEPAAAEVLINGVAKGATPLELTGLTGELEVVVRRPGFKPFVGRVDPSQTPLLKAALEPLSGVLRVITRTAGARVLLNAKVMGKTPLELSGVPVGENEIVVVPATGPPLARYVVLKADETVTIELDEATSDPTQVSPASLPFAVESLLFERKLALPETGLHVALARLSVGYESLSVVLEPSRPSLLSALADGFAVDFPGVRAPQQAQRWEAPASSWVRGIVAEALGVGGSGLRVRVTLAKGVSARVHETSSPDRLRFILVPGQ